MRSGNQLFSAVQFLMIAALFIAGSAFFGLHFLHGVRLEFSSWILQDGDRFLLLGYLVSGIAVVLTLCFWSMQRHNFLRIRMGDKKRFTITAPLLKARFEKELSQKVDVHFSHQRVEVILEGAVEDLETIEERLSYVLSSEFGYEKEFFVSLK